MGWEYDRVNSYIEREFTVTAQIELISFDLCPFVQRSAITLLHKNIPFTTTYIDLADPPDWFLEISPLKKVPLLRVEGQVLFESAVINMYLDEITPPPIEPSDPLKKAHNRAWIEFVSDMIGNQYRMSIAKSESDFEAARRVLREQFHHISAQLERGPYFNGADMSLVDCAIAPLFTRFKILDEIHPLHLYSKFGAIAHWSDHLTSLDCVKQSVKADFEEKYIAYIRNSNAYIVNAQSTSTAKAQPA